MMYWPQVGQVTCDAFKRGGGVGGEQRLKGFGGDRELLQQGYLGLAPTSGAMDGDERHPVLGETCVIIFLYLR